jgi:hypothetical protein
MLCQIVFLATLIPQISSIGTQDADLQLQNPGIWTWFGDPGISTFSHLAV